MKFKWTDVEYKAFEEIKRILDHNNLLAYLDFNKSFEINTNTRDFQLGSVISQEGRLIYF